MILTCHDEYLLATMVQGVDGALVGFATFIPGLINDLWQAVKAGDLKRAMKIQDVITPLKDAVYGGGEPTGEAHARMKMGMYLAGVLDAPTVRPPTEAPSEQEMAALRSCRRQRRPAEALTTRSRRHHHAIADILVEAAAAAALRVGIARDRCSQSIPEQSRSP